jgi:hypothetical protein
LYPSFPSSLLLQLSSLIDNHFIYRTARAWYPTRPGIWRMLMLLTSSLALIGTGFSILTGNCPFVLQLLWGNLEGPSVPFQSLLLLLHKEI